MKRLATGLSVAALLAVATLRAFAQIDEDDGAVIDWGHPELTVAEHYVLPPGAPDWLTAAFKDGGHFVTNISAWYVTSQPSDETPACLYMMLDREALAEADLCLEVELLTSPRATLFVDLTAAGYETVATNVVGNLALDHDELIRVAAHLPVADRNSATFIRLRHGGGDVLVTETTLLRIPIGGNITEALAFLTGDDATAPGSRAGDEPEGVEEWMEMVGPCFVASSVAQPTNTIGIVSATVPPGIDARELAARVIHVNKSRGRDRFSGRSRSVVLEWTDDARRLGLANTRSATNSVGAPLLDGETEASGGYVPYDGPKRSIRAGFLAAKPGGTVVVHSGVYRESPRLTGKNVKVRIKGRVVLRDGPDNPPDDNWGSNATLAAGPLTNRLETTK